MNILYISCTCSKKKFTSLFKDSKKFPGQQVQKYHRLIMEGLVLNGAKVQTLTALPITNMTYGKKFISKDEDEENGVLYGYLPMLNLPVIKNILVVICSFIRTYKYLKEHKKSFIICDALNISVTSGAMLAAKFLRRKNIGIVTDIPIFLSRNTNYVFVKINNFIINQFSYYVFLTEYMNDIINKRHVPYIVIEGQVDITMQYMENDINKKYKNKVCIYAGGLHKKYGIKYFVKAFIKADVQGSELHIYGTGDFQGELIEICKSNINIKYFGVIPNDDVVEAEMKATLLINPRPSSEEYTKYSFPSKNMEYMASGTPVLTTKLPGMPKEYHKYVYIINDESVSGVSKLLNEILTRRPIELHEKGKLAKEFVIKEKNNIIQSGKIIELIGRG